MITVHHLNFSRSSRVIWALEELDLPYTLVSYQRGPGFRAPESLKAVHPLGKAPVIEDDGLVLAESAVILNYINQRHGGGRLAPAAGGLAAVVHEEWLQYAESSAAFPILMSLIANMTGGLPDSLAQFVNPELAKTFDYLSNAVDGRTYLMGEEFTLADIQLGYLLEVAGHSGVLKNHDGLRAYVDRLKARPVYAKVMQVGGPMAAPHMR